MPPSPTVRISCFTTNRPDTEPSVVDTKIPGRPPLPGSLGGWLRILQPRCLLFPRADLQGSSVFVVISRAISESWNDSTGRAFRDLRNPQSPDLEFLFLTGLEGPGSLHHTHTRTGSFSDLQSLGHSDRPLSCPFVCKTR